MSTHQVKVIFSIYINVESLNQKYPNLFKVTRFLYFLAVSVLLWPPWQDQHQVTGWRRTALCSWSPSPQPQVSQVSQVSLSLNGKKLLSLNFCAALLHCVRSKTSGAFTLYLVFYVFEELPCVLIGRVQNLSVSFHNQIWFTHRDASSCHFIMSLHWSWHMSKIFDTMICWIFPDVFGCFVDSVPLCAL